MNYSSVNATHESVKYALWFAPGKSWKSLLLKILFQPFFPAPLSLSLFPFLCSALQIFFSLPRLPAPATRFPLFHPAQAISLSSQLSLFFTWCPSPDHFFSSFTSCDCSRKKKISQGFTFLAVPLSLLIFPRFFPLKSPAASRPLPHFQSHPLP